MRKIAVAFLLVAAPAFAEQQPPNPHLYFMLTHRPRIGEPVPLDAHIQAPVVPGEPPVQVLPAPTMAAAPPPAAVTPPPTTGSPAPAPAQMPASHPVSLSNGHVLFVPDAPTPATLAASPQSKATP